LRRVLHDPTAERPSVTGEERQDVLIVDDEAHILTALRRTLHDQPYRVHTAGSASEEIGIMGSIGVALIISDFRMPDTDGVAFLQQAKALQPDSVRMILSGYADVSAVVDAVNKGEIFKFVAKPWNDDELTLTIAQSLDHWRLLKHNRELARELLEKNSELERFNERLENEIIRRSRELLLKDKRFLLSQFIIEHLPVAVLGIDEDGMIALADALSHNVKMSGGERRMAPPLYQGLWEPLGLTDTAIRQIREHADTIRQRARAFYETATA
jgi:response regulator RpfG family c-di-GMP phosphodiesterase